MTIPISNMTTTWTDGALHTAILMDVTDTSSTAASLLMDLQVGGVSKFNIGKGGIVSGGTDAGSALVLQSTSGAGTTDNIYFRTGSQSIRGQVDTDGHFHWTSGSVSGGSFDVNSTAFQAHAGDTGDSAMSLFWGITQNTATNELVARVFLFDLTNTLTGGGHIQFMRGMNMRVNTSLNATTDNFSAIYLEGTTTGTLSTYIGLENTIAPGSTNWLFYDTTACNATMAGSLAIGSTTTGAAGSVIATNKIAAFNATAIPAGGTAGAGFTFSSTSNFGIFFGSGAPSLSAAKGSLYLRSDGTTTNDRAYINTNGTTTWTALTTAA